MAWLQAPGRRLKTRRLTRIWFPQRSSSHAPFLWVSRRDGADTRKRLYTRAMNWRKRFVARRAKIGISRAKGVMNRRRLFHFLPDEVVNDQFVWRGIHSPRLLSPLSSIPPSL